MRTACITSLDELSDHKEAWEHLRAENGGSIFSSYELVSSWLRAYEEHGPAIILVEDAGALIGVASFSLIKKSFAGLPFRTISFIGTDRGKVEYAAPGPLYDPERRDVVEAIVQCMRKQKWGILNTNFMENTRGNELFFDEVQFTMGFFHRTRCEHHRMSAPR